MPFLDPSEILLDPEIADNFDVTRRAESVDTHGRSVLTPTVFPEVVGVVTVASPNDLRRLPEEQRMERHLCIITNFRLQGPSAGRQADTVQWGGDTYIVKDVGPYPRFGQGWIQAIVGSMDALDEPPEA